MGIVETEGNIKLKTCKWLGLLSSECSQVGKRRVEGWQLWPSTECLGKGLWSPYYVSLYGNRTIWSSIYHLIEMCISSMDKVSLIFMTNIIHSKVTEYSHKHIFRTYFILCNIYIQVYVSNLLISRIWCLNQINSFSLIKNSDIIFQKECLSVIDENAVLFSNLCLFSTSFEIAHFLWLISVGGG